jgi:hypothetical protein
VLFQPGANDPRFRRHEGTRKNDLAIKPVLVHSCFNIHEDKEKPTVCGCRQFVTHREKETMIVRGEALHVPLRAHDGNFYRDGQNIVLVGKISKMPKAHMPSAGDMVKAYLLGEKSSQIFIEEYGRLRVGFFMMLAGKVKPATSSPFIGGLS